MKADSWTATIERALEDAHVLGNAETIVRSPGASIVPIREGAAERVAAWLDEIAASTRGDVDAKLRIDGLLGEGGMGVVRLAEQRALGRKVAFKTLKAGVRDDSAIEKMLHEAWITGHVEHPSVVPIHDIIVDAQGRPAIVLKRIEGQPWEMLMFDARTVERRFGARDLLEWNIGVLSQVANAIAFAHTRGIVHRDLKPENVMIGEFGEVYLVDWGLAVTIDPDADPRLPRLRPVEPMAGTPCYMAPEMLGGENAPIGRATDVYLLGSILYEIIHGFPPHRGETLEEMVRSIAISRPPISEDAPYELVRILKRAMDPDPHARFENAVQIRIALRGFLEHQGSRRLAEEADRRRDAINATIAAYEAGQKVDEATLQATYAECRFGYEQALRAWPDNEPTRAALEALVVRVAEYELGRGQPRVAAAMIAGYEDALPELAHRIGEEVRAKDKELAKLEALSRELDPETGRRTRTLLAAIVGSMWAVSPHLENVSFLAHIPEAEALVLLPIVFLGVGTVLFLWARDSMTKTAINRFLAAFVGLVLFTQILFSWAALSFGFDPVDTYRLVFLLWGLAAASIGMVAQWRMLFVAVGYFAGFFYLMRYPEHRLWVTSACHGVTTLVAILIWAPPIGAAKVLDTIDPGRNDTLTELHIARRRREEE